VRLPVVVGDLRRTVVEAHSVHDDRAEAHDRALCEGLIRRRHVAATAAARDGEKQCCRCGD